MDDDQLFFSCEHGLVEKLQELLHEGVSLTLNRQAQSPLFGASQHGHVEIVIKILITQAPLQSPLQ